MAKRYYWLKLKADWFSDKRIKKLRSIAGGDTHTIIYLKMMLLSLKDEGKLYFEGVEDNFASEIALALDDDEYQLAEETHGGRSLRWKIIIWVKYQFGRKLT